MVKSVLYPASLLIDLILDFPKHKVTTDYY